MLLSILAVIQCCDTFKVSPSATFTFPCYDMARRVVPGGAPHPTGPGTAPQPTEEVDVTQSLTSSPLLPEAEPAEEAIISPDGASLDKIP